jgi:hypothetical protein
VTNLDGHAESLAMFRRLGTTLACLAMFFVAGGHWAVLQSVAWAGMIGDYSRSDGLVTAVQKTFSGDFPCNMCRTIDVQKKQEQKTPLAQGAEKKIEGIAAESAFDLSSPLTARLFYPRPGDSLASARSDSPPAPVPILG